MKNQDIKTKGLYFEVRVNGSKKVKCERKYKEFDYLRVALGRAFPGCYVPKLVGTDLA